MRTVTAAEASRRFSELLDAIEAGETVIVMRDDRPVAEVRPARRASGRELRAALGGIAPPDDRFVSDVPDAVDMLDPETGASRGER
ncbi:type II toxin-antitoxin system Phd/YefM family antitoxin [Georgenia sp. Z1344]|uniref:type II toxin-antitoxin system Phd/YefM family antitoxin n=1 Tax=Georgenia sp. Z1344 TaxID=3416706 RepID=UPI003CE7D7FC